MIEIKINSFSKSINMKKILWVVNPLHYKQSDEAFPCYLSALIDGEITVAFLDSGIPENVPFLSNSNVMPTVEYRIGAIPSEVIEEKNEVNFQVISQIRGYFSDRNTQVIFHKKQGLTYEDILKESIFSDILLTNIALSYFDYDHNQLSSMVKSLLSKANCPIMLVPDDMQEIERIYFTYNGSYSSVFSIKQFTYLFKVLHNIPVIVLTVAEQKKEDEIENQQLLSDFLAKHYKTFSFKLLQGYPERELMIELMYQKNAIVTFGAFSRNRISQMLHKSNSENVTKIIDLPVFITHP